MTAGRAGSARRPVPSRLYGAGLLRAFAAGELEAFVAAGGRPLRPRFARALALADLRPGLRIVDLGCGRGEVAAHLTRRGARVFAVDYSQEAVALTRETVARVVADPCRHREAGVVVADATRLPVADAWADRVLLLDVVEHLRPWQVRAALAEIRRILRPGGYVVLHTLPNRWALAAAYPALRWLVPGLPAEGRSAYERSVHVNEQDPLALRAVLQAAGFESRVWVEEWTTRHAEKGLDRSYPDAARARGYPALRRPVFRRLARALMRTPARWIVGNDLFALAWPVGWPAVPRQGRFRPVR